MWYRRAMKYYLASAFACRLLDQPIGRGRRRRAARRLLSSPRGCQEITCMNMALEFWPSARRERRTYPAQWVCKELAIPARRERPKEPATLYRLFLDGHRISFSSIATIKSPQIDTAALYHHAPRGVVGYFLKGTGKRRFGRPRLRCVHSGSFSPERGHAASKLCHLSA